METSDRITIRLEREILSRMDAFLVGSPRFGSRSHLCRIAVRQFLESVEGLSNRVTVEVPRAYIDFMDALVSNGYFLSREEAIQRIVKEGLSEERVKDIIQHQETMGKASGKMFPVELERRDSVKKA
ncbi:MAG: hypothetical protein V3U52_06395 [Thermoplasmata archaeon]